MRVEENRPVGSKAPSAAPSIPGASPARPTSLRSLRLLSPVVLSLLLAVGEVTPAAHAAGPSDLEPVRFAWTARGTPAVIDVPLPENVAVEQLERVVTPPEVRLLGFAVEGEPPRLTLYLALPEGISDTTFSAVTLDLTGAQQVLNVGRVRLFAADAAPGSLSFTRSLAAAGAGLYLAVALRNETAVPVRLHGAEYLPPGVATGRLLFATGPSGTELLSALDRAPFASRRRGSAAREREALPEGFGWLRPEKADVIVEPGETIVLAWNEEAFAPHERDLAYQLQPVILYTTSELPGESRRLGLPVLLRTRP